MDTWLWVLFASVLLGIVAYVWIKAVRIDRLHRRIAQSLAIVQLALIKRAASAAQFATSGILDSGSAQQLLNAANSALGRVEDPLAVPATAQLLGGAEPRSVVESRLSEVLRDISLHPAVLSMNEAELGALIWNDLSAARYRVQVGRTLYNQDVSLVQGLRDTFLARTLRLAGFAKMPQFIDLDDNV